jgi:isopropylmalate/homocitrate/citramalate synthase
MNFRTKIHSLRKFVRIFGMDARDERACVEIFEVGPARRLQNEARAIPTAEKVALIDTLSGAGFRRIEVASFVSPRWVPQMADSAEVLAGHHAGAGACATRR